MIAWASTTDGPRDYDRQHGKDQYLRIIDVLRSIRGHAVDAAAARPGCGHTFAIALERLP